ncbi:hypothetical protein B0T14DRAFT_531728 [Immersiella caudata]|uniref:Uncharacterized protein n=1 Tax=Immersiella caudata TaxID=314043 RepID=A0AA39TI28_9PEZI|nr:hypothetical protein B0T14DRAFT_531728 [Immersiella caudata]
MKLQLLIFAILASPGNACKCISPGGRNSPELTRLCCKRSWAVYGKEVEDCTWDPFRKPDGPRDFTICCRYHGDESDCEYNF